MIELDESLFFSVPSYILGSGELSIQNSNKPANISIPITIRTNSNNKLKSFQQPTNFPLNFYSI